jgi:hypothetical protein
MLGSRTFRASVLTAGLLAVTSIPYAYARLSAPSDLVYTGLMFDVPDHAQYWSWVTASRNGLFISNTMTPEPNPAIFMNPVMWLLSRAQLVFGLSFPALFQWWRIAATLLVIPALFAFVRVMVPEDHRRRAAVLISLFGSGLGWIWVMAKRFMGTGDVPFPQDLYTVEPNTFWAMLSYPHILLAHALILATILGAWSAYHGRGWRAWALSAVAAAALSASHAYDLITIYVILGVFGLVEWFRLRKFPTRLASVGVVIGAASGPIALYYQRLTAEDPLWRAILSQYSNAGVWTPPHLHLIVLMGVPLLLAICGLVPKGSWTDERRFLAVWAVSGLGLVYLPVVFQIKLLSGWQFPLAILATHGWYERLAPIFPRRVNPRWALAAVVVLMASTNVYLFAWRLVDLRRHDSPYYLHRDEVEALDWLAANALPSDVVIAPLDLGQFVPNYGESRAYLAHWAMTNRFYERRTNVETFFAHGTSTGWRERLLSSEHITLVLTSEWGRAAGKDSSLRGSGLSPVFNRPHAQIYRYQSDAVAALAVGR